MLFQDRRDAGCKLAEELAQYAGDPKTVVLALPRGGVPVAFEVAKALNAPLDVFVVRKLGAPDQPELAMGAISTGGYCYLNSALVRQLGISTARIDQVIASEKEELSRRERVYREGRPALPLAGKTVIVVDDGLATGASMRVAVQAIRARRPDRIVVAVPVAAASSQRKLARCVDGFVCVDSPQDFQSVGLWYEDFRQTTDEEVRTLLNRANHLCAHHTQTMESKWARRSTP